MRWHGRRKRQRLPALRYYFQQQFARRGWVVCSLTTLPAAIGTHINIDVRKSYVSLHRAALTPPSLTQPEPPKTDSMEAAASGLFFFASPGADGAPDGSANASAGGGILPDDDDEPNHVGERGEG
jgi:hypothetical protein